MTSVSSTTSGFLGGFLDEDEDEVVVKSNRDRSALDDSEDPVKYATPKDRLEEVATLKSDSKFTEIERLISANVRALRERYPEGGLRSSRVITSKVLLEAPAGFFERFDEVVAEGTTFVQNMLADRGGSEIVGRSQENPTDEAMQEAAYRSVQAFTMEYLGKKVYGGIDKAIISQLITNEIIGFSAIDPLWRDKSINEIAVDGPKRIRIEISGHWRNVPSCRFRDAAHMSVLLERLFQSVGKSLSRMTPNVQGRLHDNSRLKGIHQITMPDGPALNVRRHPEKHWTPADIVARGSASPEIMTDIGNFIHKGCSYLVAGSTSTGKTSMLNALSGFYRDDMRIITIEDSLELKLNPNKMLVPGMETTPGAPDKSYLGVGLRDLVRNSLLMAPDVIIVGEAKGGEAYDLCQALNTGHAGAATLHADNAQHAVNSRLFGLIGESGVVSADAALPMIAAAFDFVIFLEHSLEDGSRKIAEVAEVPNYPEFDKSNKPFINTRTIWEIDRENGGWRKVNEVSDDLKIRKGLNGNNFLTWEELKELSKV